MVFYPCPKCNVIFNKKSNFISHTNRVFDCSIKVNKRLKTHELTEINKNSQKLTEINKNSQKLTEINDNPQILTEMNLALNDFLNPDESTFCCSYCNKKLVNKYSLLRHINESCKVKKANDEEKENTFKMLLEKDKQKDMEINQLKKQNELFEKQNKIFEKQNKMLMEKINKLINMKDNTKSSKTVNNNQKITNNIQNNNIQNNNTQNNFVMVNFGKEDLSVIDEKQFFDRIVKKQLLSGVKIPDEVLKIIHFNPMYPQLSNIYISDINRDKCMVYEDNDWKLSNIDNIPFIMDKICLFSKEQIDTLREKYHNNKQLIDRLNTIEKYNNFIDQDYIQDLIDDDEDNNKLLIKRCEDFQKLTYNTIKKTLYNEGKKIKKNIKST